MRLHFKVRHNILKILSEYQESFTLGTSSSDRLLHYGKIKEHFKDLSDNYLLDNLQFLVDEKEIHCTMKLTDSEFVVLRQGRNSYIDKKYLELGNKELREKIFDTLKIISTAVLLVIAVWTFIMNINTTQKNTKDIEMLQQQIQELNNSKSPLTDTAKCQNRH